MTQRFTRAGIPAIPVIGLICLVTLFLGALMPGVASCDDDATRSGETLWVDGAGNEGNLKLINGFLHGQDEQSPKPDYERVKALKPEVWRLYKYNSYKLAEEHNAGITYEVSNHYAWTQGGHNNAKPWLDWDAYEAYILYTLQVYDYYFPEDPPDFYDIWNEPDHPYFWIGNYSQLLELFSRTYHVIKSFNPNAKIVGPSISWFRPGYSGVQGLIDFIVDLDAIYDVRLDAIAWHENGGVWYDTRPDGIPYRANYLRNQIQLNLPGYTPEFHVNEYMGGQVHLSPGWNVAYLHYLEEAEIDRSTRAGWWVYSLDDVFAGNGIDYWNTCWYGMNGMLMKDGKEPQPAYWVNQTHADMEGEEKLFTASSDLHTNIIATRNQNSKMIRLLTGRHLKSSAADVTVHVYDYTYTHNDVLVVQERVPNFPEFYDDPPKAIPFPDGPIHIQSEILPVDDGDLDLIIEDFGDGDAFIITIIPPPGMPDLSGSHQAQPMITFDYHVLGATPDGSDIHYFVEWGDGTDSGWLGPHASGEAQAVSQVWPEIGVYTVRCKSKSTDGLESVWSEPFKVRVSVWPDLKKNAW